MQLGCCIGPDHLHDLAAAGGEYAEFTVAGTVMGGDDAAFEQLVERVAAAAIKPRAYNVLLPGDYTVVGPAVDRARLETYVRTAFARIARLSGPGAIVVIGSGRARSIPDGFDRATAFDQLAEFLGWVGAAAREAGIVIALEHLRRAESNVFTTLRESGDFIRARELHDVRLLVDLYHLMEEGEPLATIDDHADLLVHAHVADSERRHPGTGSYPIADFFARLAANGYAGRCSIECRWGNFPVQIGPAMAALRHAAAR
jgi:D-psicose/D-tagatose/L-ribulose 3-epimerase